MSAHVIIVRQSDGTVHVEVESLDPRECTHAARRLRAISALLGGRLKGMEVPLDPQVVPIGAAPQKVKA